MSDSAVFDVLNKCTNLELSDNDASNSNNHTSNSRIYLSSSNTTIDDYNISQDKSMVFKKFIVLIKILFQYE